MSLPESLEHAASELNDLSDRIRPANGDPHRLLAELEADQAGELLTWILRHEPGVAEELIEAWGETEAGASVLLAQREADLPKPARKLLRKAHHRLRSQGYEVAPAEKAAAAPAVRRMGGDEDRWQAAHVSVPDFRGARMGYLAEPHPAGGARLFEVRFDEGRGILDFRVYNAGRSKVRGFLRSLTEGQSQHLFEVDRGALCALVRRASLAQPADRPLPTGFVEWRSRLFPESVEQAPTPGAEARGELAGRTPPATALADVLEEVRAGRLGPWPPGTTWVGERMDEGRARLAGLADGSREKAIDAWLEQTSAALAESSRAGLIARHLEEMAWIRWRAEQPDEARALIAVADAVSDAVAPDAVADAGSGEDEAWARLARARAEAIFEPFLEELRGAARAAGDGEAAG